MKYANPLHSAALAAYPVGSIYMSVAATDPGTLFGGTWSRIYGKFLFAADGNIQAGQVGGAERVALSEEELPELRGGIMTGSGENLPDTNGYGVFRSANGICSTTTPRHNGQPMQNAWSSFPAGEAYAGLNISFGGGQPHNNMPPYLAVYVWQRTA